MEKPPVRHAGCQVGGLVTVLRFSNGQLLVVCQGCGNELVDPSLECLHEAQPRPKPLPRVAQFYGGSVQF